MPDNASALLCAVLMVGCMRAPKLSDADSAQMSVLAAVSGSAAAVCLAITPGESQDVSYSLADVWPAQDPSVEALQRAEEMIHTVLPASRCGAPSSDRRFVALGPVWLSSDRKRARLVSFTSEGALTGQGALVELRKGDDGDWTVEGRRVFMQE